MTRIDDDYYTAVKDKYSYESYTCRQHGRFWSDSGACCPYCPDSEPAAEPEPDDDDEDEGVPV